jgi:hypothetical protein
MKFHLPNFLVEISQGNSIFGSMISTLAAGVLFAAVNSLKPSHVLGVFVLTSYVNI